MWERRRRRLSLGCELGPRQSAESWGHNPYHYVHHQAHNMHQIPVLGYQSDLQLQKDGLCRGSANPGTRELELGTSRVQRNRRNAVFFAVMRSQVRGNE